MYTKYSYSMYNLSYIQILMLCDIHSKKIIFYFREWQMYRAFQTIMTLHKPDVVFILGM
jgi:hypothetical protein